ncbi:hypothetical protein G9A89_000112 [Geosiphon pyriformis]|nr:hypothetical protein G9A89_000112 [Geosiphon pyriformis]
MFIKKLARGATTSSVNGSLRQKSKVLLKKIKHLGNEADLFFKLPVSNSGWYKNMNISSNKKLGHEIGKNMDYGAGSENDGPLDSCINTSKAKCFNSDTVKTPSLGLYNFGSAINDINMNLSPLVFWKPLFIHLMAVSGSTLCDKLKSVKKLFYKIDGFGGASTPSKFPGIIRASFMSEFSFALAKQLAVSENLISILLGKDSMCVVKANANKQTWDLRNSYHTLLYTLLMDTTVHDLSNLVWSYDAKKAAIHSMMVFKSVNLVWTESVDGLMPVVMVLALHVSVLKHSLENVFDQVANISCKLNRLLAVLLASFTVLHTPKHNPVLNMAVDTLLFIPLVPSVVTAISQDISPSGSRVLTMKISGLKANLVVLKNSVKAILNKLDSFGSGSSVVTPFLLQ